MSSGPRLYNILRPQRRASGAGRVEFSAYDGHSLDLCDMKRVMVVGSGGAGKSTFSRRLSELTGLPVIHLDNEFWRPNWERTPADEWTAKVTALCSNHEWIMDGNFGGTRSIRLRASDTVIILDTPRRVCMYRAIKRAFVFKGRTRPDMAAGCNERLDLEFLLWIWNYKNRGGRRLMDEIETETGKEIIILRSAKDIEKFFRTVENSRSES